MPWNIHVCGKLFAVQTTYKYLFHSKSVPRWDVSRETIVLYKDAKKRNRILLYNRNIVRYIRFVQIPLFFLLKPDNNDTFDGPVSVRCTKRVSPYHYINRSTGENTPFWFIITWNSRVYGPCVWENAPNQKHSATVSIYTPKVLSRICPEIKMYPRCFINDINFI